MLPQTQHDKLRAVICNARWRLATILLLLTRPRVWHSQQQIRSQFYAITPDTPNVDLSQDMNGPAMFFGMRH